MSEHNWHTRDFDADATGPMTGVRVLDLSRLVAGNMCSLQLADFGADVVKVEPQPVGDPLRAWKQQGQSTFWKTYGRNKRSIALDFRADGGLEVLERLMAQADVMVESFRRGTMEKMGLGPDVLEKRFPQLICFAFRALDKPGPIRRVLVSALWSRACLASRIATARRAETPCCHRWHLPT